MSFRTGALHLYGGSNVGEDAYRMSKEELARRQQTGEPSDSEWKSDGHGGQVYRRTISTGPLPKQRDS